MNIDEKNQLTKAADQKFCFSCSKLLHFSAKNCPRCGATQPGVASVELSKFNTLIEPTTQILNRSLLQNHVYCRGCGNQIHETAFSCPKCGATQHTSSGSNFGGDKDRMTAALLAFFLGGIGAHKFYLERWVQGVLYLVFCWTFIPAIISIIDGIVYLNMSDESFRQKY